MSTHICQLHFRFLFLLKFNFVVIQSPVVIKTISKYVMQLIPCTKSDLATIVWYIFLNSLGVNAFDFRTNAARPLPPFLFLTLLPPSLFACFFIHVDTPILLFIVVNKIIHVHVVIFLVSTIIPYVMNIWYGARHIVIYVFVG